MKLFSFCKPWEPSRYCDEHMTQYNPESTDGSVSAVEEEKAIKEVSLKLQTIVFYATFYDIIVS